MLFSKGSSQNSVLKIAANTFEAFSTKDWRHTRIQTKIYDERALVPGLHVSVDVIALPPNRCILYKGLCSSWEQFVE